MEATTPGRNRTGAAVSPDGVKQMIKAVDDLSPPGPIDTASMEAMRLTYINESDSVGSIPPPASLLRGSVKKGVAALNGVSPSLFMDKIGERIAFERTGTRLYDGLIAKYLALSESSGELLLPFDQLPADIRQDGGLVVRQRGESALETLQRIRAEELGHFLLLCECMTQMGGDPTAQTPCADVAATASMGVMQVISDPRTTLAQSLNAALMAELTDNASWELLEALAARAGQAAMATQFRAALAAEQEHLIIVRAWLKALTLDEAGTEAV